VGLVTVVGYRGGLRRATVWRTATAAVNPRVEVPPGRVGCHHPGRMNGRLIGRGRRTRKVCCSNLEPELGRAVMIGDDRRTLPLRVGAERRGAGSGPVKEGHKFFL